jgi:Fe-S-cluster containining protein
MVQFDTPCAWLKDGRCTHYALRPDICREYDPAECERYATTPAERFVLRNEKDLERFLAEREARLEADRAKRAARRKNGSRGRATA